MSPTDLFAGDEVPPAHSILVAFPSALTRYGRYNIAEPEKARFDCVYLHRNAGDLTAMDEFDLRRLDRAKLFQYAARYPALVKQQVLETVANFCAL